MSVTPGSLAGPYRTPQADFDLDWHDAEQGYRRRFEPAHWRGWVFDEARLYTAAEVTQKLRTNAWQKRTRPLQKPSNRGST